MTGLKPRTAADGSSHFAPTEPNHYLDSCRFHDSSILNNYALLSIFPIVKAIKLIVHDWFILFFKIRLSLRQSMCSNIS